MAKLSSQSTALKPGGRKKASSSTAGTSPIKAKGTTTAKGGAEATKLKAKSELFLTAVTTMAGESTYYESGADRIERLVGLVDKVTTKDPDWVERFVAWLRGPEGNIRTASIIIAVEYVMAGGPNGRAVINSVCQRADEPAEILAYIMQNHYGWNTQTYPLPSPKLKQSIRKGLGDACRRLYTPYSAMKYAGNQNGVSMANVLDLVHPTPKDEEQGRVFQYIKDRARGNATDTSMLPLIAANHRLRDLTPEQFRKELNPETLKAAGVTWEQVGTYLNGQWDANAWEAMIPSMGYMALLRNLRNFEQAGISKGARKRVCDILTDPDRVATSRQFPFRFLSAYMNLEGDYFKTAVQEALDLSVTNIPSFGGKTLILVDLSGSMSNHLSGGRRDKFGRPVHDNVARPRFRDVGALFGVALALKGEDVTLAGFGTYAKEMSLPSGTSVLKGMAPFDSNHGVGHGTDTNGAVQKMYRDHDRIVIFTDIQPNYGRAVHAPQVPFIHYFDLTGYGQGAADLKEKGRFQYGGFTDSTFKLMLNLEAGANESWPF